MLCVFVIELMCRQFLLFYLLYLCCSVLSFYFLYMCLFFFFFKQKTAYEMRISDWSSDVCSSDLRLASVDPDAALVRPDQAQDAFQHHRLAGAGAADHDEALARAELEVDALEHALGAEALRDALKLDLGGPGHRAKNSSVMP